MDFNGENPVAIQAVAWATPKEGMSLQELEDELQAIGNTILEIDEENNRIKVLDVTESLT